MNFDLFKGIICENFKTATLKKYYDNSNKAYYFTFAYLDFEKNFVIEESKIRDFSIEILAYHMKTLIEVEYVDFLQNAENNIPSQMMVELVEKEEENKTIVKKKRGKSRKVNTDVES